MAYNIHWIAGFRDIDEKSYTINIYEDGYIGAPEELTLGADPFVTDEDDNDEDVFLPVRTQTGYINIVTTDDALLSSLMPTVTKSRPVEVVSEEGTIVWRGYIKRQLYSQSWMHAPDEIQLPVISLLETAKDIQFTEEAGFTNLLAAIDMIGLPHPVEVVMPEAMAGTINNYHVANGAFQSRLSPPERFELSTNPAEPIIYKLSSVYDAIYEWCRFFGLTAREYNGSIVLSNITEQNVMADLSELEYTADNHTQQYTEVYETVKGVYSVGAEEDLISLETFRNELPWIATDAATEAYIYNCPDFRMTINQYNGRTAGTMPLTSPLRTDFVNMVGTDYAGAQLSNILNENDIHGKDGITTRHLGRLVYGFEKIAFTLRNIYPLYFSPFNSGKRFLQRLHISMSGKWHERVRAQDPITWADGVGYHCIIMLEGARSENRAYWNGSAWVTTKTRCSIISGVDYYIELPSNSLTAWNLCDLTIDFLLNDYNSAGEEIPFIADRIQRIEDFRVEIETQEERNREFVPSLEDNTYQQRTGAVSESDFEFNCKLTSSQPGQIGLGIIRYSNGRRYTIGRNNTQEKAVVDMMKNYLGTPHELLTIIQGSRFSPSSVFTFHDKRYSLISQSTNWRDKETTIKIVEL